MKGLFKSSIITSAVLLALGLLLVFESEATIATIAYVIGALLIAAGVLALLRFYKNNKKGEISTVELDILYGIVSIILGIVVINNPRAIASILPIVLGVAIIISSANKIQYAFNLKNNGNELWKTTMIIALISVVCGVVLLFNPFAGAVLIMRIIGIFIIAYSILDIVSTIIIKKNVEEFKGVIDKTRSIENEVIEADVVENKEKKTTVKKTTTKVTKPATKTAAKKTAAKAAKPATKTAAKKTATKATKPATKTAAKKTTTKAAKSATKKTVSKKDN